MAKFEVGDKVKLVMIDSRDDGVYVPQLNSYLRDVGEVLTTGIKVDRHDEYVCKVKFDDDWWYLNEDWLELVEKAKPKYYTGKVVCIKKPTVKNDSAIFTVGKVYDIKDGQMFDDDPCACTDQKCPLPYRVNISSLKQLNEHSLRGEQFIEFKGFAE